MTNSLSQFWLRGRLLSVDEREMSDLGITCLADGAVGKTSDTSFTIQTQSEFTQLAGPSSSIIPSLGLPGVPPNTSNTVIFSADATVASGQIIYANPLPMGSQDFATGEILVYVENMASTLTNNGVLWDSNTPSNGAPGPAVAVVTNGRVVNHGEIVADVDTGYAQAILFYQSRAIDGPQLDNSGQIYAITRSGNAFTVFTDDYSHPIVNSGIIAAKSYGGEGYGFAEALQLYNGGSLTNATGASILAEGTSGAIAVRYMNQNQPSSGSDTLVTNNGLIQAVSTDPDGYAIGIYIADIHSTLIDNAGTISADIAIFADSFAFSPPQKTVDIVTNESTGHINGVIFLDLGDDQVINKGAISGVVVMGEGNDSVDTSSGTIIGYTDLGNGGDTYVGGASDDDVLGNRGDDILSGGSGQDLLLGGYGNDTLTGGSGSDGLWGEFGDDVIVANAGDFVSGGAGDDRIELLDLGGFGGIDGGTGLDTLVLPDSSRLLDLHGALTTGVIAGIDEVSLGSAMGLVLRASDVLALSDSNRVVVRGNTTNHLYLLASWVEGVQQLVDGINYRTFDNGSSEVLAQAGMSVGVQVTSPGGAQGFDPAPGPQAPFPNPDFLASDVTVTSDYNLYDSFVVFAEETWISPDGSPVFTCDDPSVSLTNFGTISSSNDSPGGASAIGVFYVTQITNYGHIVAFSDADHWGFVTAVFIGSVGHLHNVGTIDAYSLSEDAFGVRTWDDDFVTAGFVNDGTIHARSDALTGSNVGTAIGAQVFNDTQVVNNGLIAVEGYAPVGMSFDDSGTLIKFTNTGSIVATAYAGGKDSIGLLGDASFFNTGSIVADVAFRVPIYDQRSNDIHNSGHIGGRIELDAGSDSIANGGSIDGTIVLGSGNDSYDGQSGHLSGGGVFGQDGDDTLTGGVDNEIFDGGAGNDVINGGGGTNTASYEDALAGVTVSLASTLAQNTVGAGVDILSGIKNLRGSEYGDTLSGNSSDNTIEGRAGSDVLIGAGGSDTLTGGLGSDIFRFVALLDLTAAGDHITDFSYQDTIDLSAIGGLSFIGQAAFSHVAGQIRYGFVGDTTIVEVDANGDGAVDGRIVIDSGAYQLGETAFGSRILFIPPISGTAGDDNLIGTPGRDVIQGNAGDDVLAGGPGNDILDGGAGSDTVSYAAATGGVAVDLSNIGLQAVGADQSSDTLLLIENLLGSSFNDTLKGDAGANRLVGGGGNNTLAGQAGNDILDVSLGHFDTVNGGDGDDLIVAGAAFGTGDAIDGGIGFDTLQLSGNYGHAGVSLTAANFANCEQIQLAAGFSYKITIADNVLAAYSRLTIDGSALAPGNNLTVDASLETGGDYTITGGAGDDLVLLGPTLSSRNGLDGGAGSDTILINGDYSASTPLPVLRNIETLELQRGHSYNFYTADVDVASGQVLAINGADLGASDWLRFNGSYETNGSFAISGGAGDDTLSGGGRDDTFDVSAGGNDLAVGGKGNDTFVAGSALTVLDRIVGGAGTDELKLNGDYSLGLRFAVATLQEVEKISLAAGHSYVMATDDVMIGGTLTLDGSLLGTQDRFSFDGSAETNGNFMIACGSGDDVVWLGKGGDIVIAGKGNDVINAGGGFTSADQIDGGLGTDTLSLVGNYKAGVILGALTLVGVEQIDLASGFQYKITTNDANVAVGKVLAVNGSQLGAADTLTLDGSAESDGSFNLIGGLGNDILTGGAQADAFDLSIGGRDTLVAGGGDDTITMGVGFGASDKIDGGTGFDTVALNGDYSGGVTMNATTLVNVEKITLAAGHSYGLITSDTTVAAGQTLTVDGSHLGLGEKLTFRGNAETDGRFVVNGGSANDFMVGGLGDDKFVGGGGDDTFDLTLGGNDIANGTGGTDTFRMGDALTALDQIDGGPGSANLLDLNGDYAAGIVFTSTTVLNIGIVKLHAGHSYSLTSNDATVAAAQAMKVDGTDLGATDHLSFDGSAESNGAFVLIGGAGADILIGGSGGDKLTGGLGADGLTGGAGADTFVYKAAAESAGAGYDTLAGFDFAADRLDVVHKAKAIDAAVAAGGLSTASFDTDMTAALAGHLGKYHAILFTANAGTLSGQTFLVVDANGIAGYQAGQDLVIHLDSAVNAASLSTANFI